MTNYPAPTAQIQGNQGMPLVIVIQLHTRSKASLLLVTICVVQASRWWSQAQWSEDCSATRDNYGRTENLLGQLQGAAPWIIRHRERQRPDLPLGAIGSWAHRTWVWSFGHFPAASARLTISPAHARITALSQCHRLPNSCLKCWASIREVFPIREECQGPNIQRSHNVMECWRPFPSYYDSDSWIRRQISNLA